MTSLSPSDIRILEQTRQRLSQLTESLNSLNRDIHTSHPLPSWTSLTTRFTILSTNLSTLSALLHTHASTLDKVSVFPLPRFPAREHENVLVQLLRKKLEPAVEEWVEEGWRVGGGVGKEDEKRGGERGGMRRDEWRELWDWGPVRANEEARGYEWFTGEYTREEREEGGMDVDGGEEEEEEKDDGDEQGDGKEGEKEEGGAGKTVKMEDMLRFMSTGVQPR